MSMHNTGEDSYERINKSVPATEREKEEEAGAKKRCIIIVLLICVLVAAVTALILVLVLKGSDDDDLPRGYNNYLVETSENDKWKYEAIIVNNGTEAIPINETDWPSFDNLKVKVSMMNDQSFRMKINPVLPPMAEGKRKLSEIEDDNRWEVPDDLMGNTKDDYGMRLTWGSFDTSNSPFGMTLANPQNSGINWISTVGRNLVFTEYYIEQGFVIESQQLYGFGERVNAFEMEPGNYTGWSNGVPPHPAPTELGHNLYGDHPFVLARLKDNTFVGIFFKNSNAKSLEYTHVSEGRSILNFRSTGGVLDFFFFAAEKAEDVIKDYHQVIGTPNFPPFWALGFHQSSLQYTHENNASDAVIGYEQAEIPLESIWLDIPYLKDYKNFEVNTTNFPNIPTFREALRRKNQKLVVIVDPWLVWEEDYQSFEIFKENKVLITTNQNPSEFEGILIGRGFGNKYVCYPDFFNPETQPLWIEELKKLHQATTFDGLWIDMNEIENLCDGECPGEESKNVSDPPFDGLPYVPLGPNQTLNDHTLSMDGQHWFTNDEEKKQHVEFNLHSLYGILESRSTHAFWEQGEKLQGKRPFVLSRSTFPGSGKYAAHWLGDNRSTWDDLKQSIAGIMSFNFYGIPMVGPDVCGFFGNMEEDMCARWYQLSAFYPFARNHYTSSDPEETVSPQEPFNFEDKYKESARLAVLQRYSFLRYFYTRLFEISKQGGGTLVRPLFFEFPEDEKAYLGYEHTFMVGDALKVTPVLTKADSDREKVESYFPDGSRWISLNDFTSVVEGDSKGVNRTLDAPWEYTIVHQKEGTVIPWQYTASGDYMTTTNLINDAPVRLVVFPDKNGHAEGTLYIDEDGDDTRDFALGDYQYYKFRYSNSTMQFDLLDGRGSKGDDHKGNQVLAEILILGVEFNDTTKFYGCAYDNNLAPREIEVDYDKEKNILNLGAIDTENDVLYFENLQSIQFTTEAENAGFCKAQYKVGGVKTVYSMLAGSNEDPKATTKILEIESVGDSKLPDLQATFSLLDNNLLRVQIGEKDVDVYQAPAETFGPDAPINETKADIDIDEVLTLPEEGSDFYYEVHAKGDAELVLYSTKDQPFVYSKYYKKHTAFVNSNHHTFGLGERVGEFLLGEGIYTMWNRDIPSPTEDGKKPGKQVYGTHPVYFTQLKSNNQFIGVFDHNVGAQDYILKQNDDGIVMTQIKTSGVTDQFIMLNDDIPHVIDNFIRLVGKPTLVPEWSLGWHQCRYGYNSTEQVETVVNKYIENKIPLDVMWTDIDYMDMYKDFTVSTTDFHNISDAVKLWREKHDIRYVPILDAGLAFEGGSDTPYSRGDSADVFIKDPVDDSKPFIGKVWPGPAVYVDWFKENAESYWVDEMKKLHDQLPYDGMWIDMNEASNFCNGYCFENQKVPRSIQDDLFYVPGARDLNDKSISIDAVHHNGVTEFEAHSTYGFYMSKATSAFFTQAEKPQRPFVITRSTYSGVGKYVSHWLGDNFAQFDMLRYSIGGIHLFNMFGVPVTGADICGFIFDTNAHLCARWYAIGAFYPFARNHNDKAARPQEPYVAMFQEKMDDSDMTYTDFIREMSLKRYALHRYAYSNLHKATTDGTPYFRPMFYDYSDDKETFNQVDENVMLGDSIKVSPVVSEGTAATHYYPGKNKLWCPLWPKHTVKCFGGQKYQTIEIKYDEVFVHIASGSIIPLQIRDFASVPEEMNLSKLKDMPTDLAILNNHKYQAKGWVRFDDGETLDFGLYTEVRFNSTGYSPTFGTAYINIDFETVQEDSLDTTSVNQELGDLVVYQANYYKLTKSAKGTVHLKEGELAVDFSSVECDSDKSICRFGGISEDHIKLTEIKTIHIES